MSLFLATFVDGIMFGGVYALLALGLVLLYKASKVLNFAYGAILVFLGYVLVTFVADIGLPPWAGILLVLVVAAVLGLVLYRFILHPVIGEPFFVMIILTLVVGLVFRGMNVLGWGEPRPLLGIIPSGSLTLGTDIIIRYQYLISFLVAIALFILMVLLFQRTKVGLGMRCVSEDHQISQSMGINVRWIFLISMIISCMIAAVGGLLLGSDQTVSNNLEFYGLGKAFPVMLLGGMESIPGVLVGGLIVGVAEQLCDAYIGGEFVRIVPFILMLVILLFRPHGLFGLKTIERI